MVKSNSKFKVGKVISTKMDHTIVVAVTWKSRHIKYGKLVGKLSKFKAHDAKGSCSLGDMVKIIECRPISKTKRWLLEEIMESKGHSVVDQGFVDEPVSSSDVITEAASEDNPLEDADQTVTLDGNQSLQKEDRGEENEKVQSETSNGPDGADELVVTPELGMTDSAEQEVSDNDDQGNKEEG